MNVCYRLYAGLASMAHQSEPYMPFDGEDERYRKKRQCQGFWACSWIKEEMPGSIKTEQLLRDKKPERR